MVMVRWSPSEAEDGWDSLAFFYDSGERSFQGETCPQFFLVSSFFSFSFSDVAAGAGVGVLVHR